MKIQTLLEQVPIKKSIKSVDWIFSFIVIKTQKLEIQRIYFRQWCMVIYYGLLCTPSNYFYGAYVIESVARSDFYDIDPKWKSSFAFGFSQWWSNNFWSLICQWQNYDKEFLHGYADYLNAKCYSSHLSQSKICW